MARANECLDKRLPYGAGEVAGGIYIKINYCFSGILARVKAVNLFSFFFLASLEFMDLGVL